MRPERRGGECPTSVKLDLVLRLLGGETPEDLARQTGRSKRQLSAWRQRFLAGGEAYLEGRPDHQQTEAIRSDRDELSAQVAELSAELAELTAENRALAQRVALLGAERAGGLIPHPYCSEPYSRASQDAGARPLHVPDWGAYVLVREGRGGTRHATGVRPLASLAPDGDVEAGLEALRRSGIASVSLVTDPMWCPQLSVLRQAFDTCRAFREHYVVDREAELRFHKRHRSRLNEAQRVCEVQEVALAGQLERWLELYELNVASRQISQPFTPAYFEQLAALPALRAIAVLVAGEIVAITLWIRHEDTFYFHDGASNATGYETSAAYAAFAHAIERAADCRYVLLGGSSGFRDERLDGLAMFKRGFSNASALGYLCSVTLQARAAGRPRELSSSGG